MSYPVFYVEEGDTLPILFDTFDGGTGASITLTGLAVTDIEIYKDGSATQRASDAGYTLLDTDGIDFDSVTGIHGFSIDLSDNTDTGFYAVGSWYHVVVSSVTIDAQTVNFIAASFRIVSATRGMAGTALPDAAADAAGGLPISDAGGLDLDSQIGTDIDAILVDTSTTLQGELDGIQADTEDIQSKIGTPAGVSLAADIAENQTDLNTILADTNELQADWTNGGRLDLIIDDILLDTGTTLQAELDGIQADTEDIQTKIGTPAGASLAADVAENQTDLNSILTNVAENQTDLNTILADTNELQADWTNGGRLDLIIDDILLDTGTTLQAEHDTTQSAISALNNLSAADVNAEVVDALATDTYAEPTGVPAATDDLATKIGYIYMALRNKVTVTATKKTFFDDGDTAEWEKDLSDDGTTYTETEANAI